MQKKNYEDLRDTFFDEVYAIAKEDKDFVFLTVDMGATLMERFRKEFPDRCINVGISEQNAVLTAAGLASCGKKVFVYGITSFLILRSVEQIKLDVCYMNYPVTIAGIGTGFTYGTDGPTHYAIDDLAVVGSLPEINIYCPSDNYMQRALVRRAYREGKPSYLRLEKGKHKDLYDPETTFDGSMKLLKDGSNLIIATGVMVTTAIDIANELEKEGISVGVLDLYKIKPLEWKELEGYVTGKKTIFTIEEHVLHGGIGGIVSKFLCDDRLFIPLRQFGIRREILLNCRKREKMLEICGLDKETLKKEIRAEILR